MARLLSSTGATVYNWEGLNQNFGSAPPEGGLVLDVPGCVAFHFSILSTDGKPWVEPRNGVVYLNGFSTEKAWLNEGDTLQIGHTVFVFSSSNIPKPQSLQNGFRLKLQATGHEYPITEPNAMLGSQPSHGSIAAISGLLPQHCDIGLTDRGVWFRNTAQDSSLKVNGVPLTQGWLEQDDILTLGHLKFDFLGPGTKPVATSGKSTPTKVKKPSSVLFKISMAAITLVFLGFAVFLGLKFFGNEMGALFDSVTSQNSPNSEQIQLDIPISIPETSESSPILPVDVSVDPFSLALRARQVDLHFEGHPLNLRFMRVLNGSEDYLGPLGMHWSHNYDYSILLDNEAGIAEVALPGSHIIIFKVDSLDPNHYTSPGGQELEIAGTRIIMFTPDQKALVFSQSTGQIFRIHSPNGPSLEFTYEAGLLTQVLASSGEWIRLEYNSHSFVSHVADSKGNNLDYQYDKSGLLAVISRNGQLCAQYRYDNFGNLQELFMSGLTWKVGYGPNGKVLEFTDPVGILTTHEVTTGIGSINHRRTTPNGAVNIQTLHPAKNKLVTIAPDGGKTTVILNPDTGSPLSITNALGQKTVYKYDKLGRITRESKGGKRVRGYSYYKNTAYPTSLVLENGLKISTKYDENMNIIKTTNPVTGSRVFTYDESGRILQEKDEYGIFRKYEYKASWIPEKITNGDGKVLIKFDFDLEGTPSAFTLGAKKTISLNSLGPGLVIDRQLKLDRLAAVANGKSVSSPEKDSSYSFDNMGNIVHILFPDNSTRSYSYDLSDRVANIMFNGKSKEKRFYNLLGNIQVRQLPDNRKMNFKYNQSNQVIQITDSDGTAAGFKYESGKLAGSSFNGFNYEYHYDDRYRVLSEEFLFTACPERKIAKSSVLQPKSEPTPKKKLRTRVKDFFVKRKNKEKKKVEEKQKIQPEITTVVYSEYEKTPSNRETTIKKAGNHVVEYQLQNRGILKSINSSFGQFTFDYDENGNMKSIHYPNGIAQKFSYKTRNLTIDIGKNSRSVFKSEITLNPRFLTESRTLNQESVSYKYDENDQLIKAVTENETYEYTYDTWGNRSLAKKGSRSATTTYLPGAYLASDGENQFEWDALGRLKTKKTPHGDIQFKFDLFGNLVGISGPDGKTVSYFYNASGLMVGRKTGGKTRFYLLNGLDPIVELNGFGHVVTRYVYAPGTDQILAMEEVSYGSNGEATSSVAFFHRDERNNVVLVTDSKGGTLASYTYDPFGNVVSRTGDFEAPFLFAGCRYEPLFNLYYMRSRFYDPSTGRFLSPDSKSGDPSAPLSTNPYLYVENSPMNFIDPMGTEGHWFFGSGASIYDNLENVVFGSTMGKLAKQVSKKVDALSHTATQNYLMERLNGYIKGYGNPHAWQKLAGKNTMKVLSNGMKLISKVDFGILHTLGTFIKKEYDSYQKNGLLNKPVSAQIDSESNTLATVYNVASGLLGNYLSSSTKFLIPKLGKIVTANPGSIIFSLVANWSAGRVGEAYKTMRESQVAEKDAKEDAKLAHLTDKEATERMRHKIKKLIANGNPDGAEKLNKRYKDYLKRINSEGKNRYGFNDEFDGMIERAKIQKEKDDQNAKDVKRQNDVEDYDENRRTELVELEKQEAEANARFSFKIVFSKTVFIPGEEMSGRIKIKGGKAPFTFEGAYSGSSSRRDIPFSLDAPSDLGIYEISITAKDQNEARSDAVNIIVKNKLTLTLSPVNPETFVGDDVLVEVAINNGVPPYQLNGFFEETISTPSVQFKLPAQPKPGPFRVDLHVVDAQNEKAYVEVLIQILPKDTGKPSPQTAAIDLDGVWLFNVDSQHFEEVTVTGGSFREEFTHEYNECISIAIIQGHMDPQTMTVKGTMRHTEVCTSSRENGWETDSLWVTRFTAQLVINNDGFSTSMYSLDTRNPKATTVYEGTEGSKGEEKEHYREKTENTNFNGGKYASDQRHED